MRLISDGLLLAAAQPADGQQIGLFGQLVPFILIFVVFYFLVFAPMRKKQRLQTEMIQNLKAGDRIITNGGIHGTVVGVGEDVLQVRIADQVKIEISKNAVAAMQAESHPA